MSSVSSTNGYTREEHRATSACRAEMLGTNFKCGQTSGQSVPLKRSMEFCADRVQTSPMTSHFLTQLASQLRKGQARPAGGLFNKF